MINVLVVEDDPMVAQLHEHYLSQIKGFELCGIARCGDDALNLLKARNYDLLILDVFMPSMDGLQLLAKIRENGFGRENIPAMMAAVVVISVPLIVLFLIFHKKIMAGVARGGMKG